MNLIPDYEDDFDSEDNNPTTPAKPNKKSPNGSNKKSDKKVSQPGSIKKTGRKQESISPQLDTSKHIQKLKKRQEQYEKNISNENKNTIGSDRDMGSVGRKSTQ